MNIKKSIILIIILCLQLYFQLLPVLCRDDLVVTNIKSNIYRKTECKITKKCKFCLVTTKQRAVEVYKAVPCKICSKKK